MNGNSVKIIIFMEVSENLHYGSQFSNSLHIYTIDYALFEQLFQQKYYFENKKISFSCHFGKNSAVKK